MLVQINYRIATRHLRIVKLSGIESNEFGALRLPGQALRILRIDHQILPTTLYNYSCKNSLWMHDTMREDNTVKTRTDSSKSSAESSTRKVIHKASRSSFLLSNSKPKHKRDMAIWEVRISFHPNIRRTSLFELLLGAQLTGVSTALLAAILGTRRKSCVAFSAYGLFAIVLLGQKGQRWVIDTST